MRLRPAVSATARMVAFVAPAVAVGRGDERQVTAHLMVSVRAEYAQKAWRTVDADD